MTVPLLYFRVPVMGKKRKSTEDGELELPKKRQTSRAAKESEKRLIVVLEGAHLETCKVGDCTCWQGCRYGFIFCGSGCSCGFFLCASGSSFTKLRCDFKLVKYYLINNLLRLTHINTENWVSALFFN